MQSQDNPEIGILGGEGLLGSDLVKFLSKNHKIDTITKESYAKKKGTEYKILINANGNSKRFWANQNPKKDFFLSTASVVNSIFDFPCSIYIYISSSDVYENHTAPQFTKENQIIDPNNLSLYGFNKYMSELVVKKYKAGFLILRSSMILGTNLKKGPFYDIFHNKPLFITPNTRLQIITTRAVAEIIEILLKRSIISKTLNIGGSGTFSFKKICRYIKREFQISKEAKKQIYEMNVKKIGRLYPDLKKSEEYLQEFLDNYKHLQ